jgi:integrase
MPKMPKIDPKTDTIVRRWFQQISAKENTRKNYLSAINKFCSFTGKTPKQLLTEADDEERDGVKMRDRNVKMYILDFKDHLDEQGLAEVTVRNTVTPILSFYRTNDVILPDIKLKKASPLHRHRAFPTKEELREVLKVCDPFEKAIILVGVASGLAREEIINLRISDFKKGYDSKDNVTILDLRRGKNENDLITFLTPEASQAVWDYLNFRNRTSKYTDTRVIEHLKKQKVYSDEGYLFIIRNVSPEFLDDIPNNEHLRKIEESTFLKIYNAISEKAQKTTPKGEWNLIRSHNMRKYFTSTLRNNGCDTSFVEFMLAHKLSETQRAYFHPDPVKLKEQYMKYMDFLKIQPERDFTESPEYQGIKHENDILRAETARHVVERSELQELRAELEAKAGQEADLNNKVATLTEMFESMQEAFKNSQASDKSANISDVINVFNKKRLAKFKEKGE